MISPALKHKYYSDSVYNGKFNGTSRFYSWLREIAKADFRVLNLGAGPTTGQKERSLKGEVAEVVGADIDPVVLTNSELDRAVVIKNGKLDLAADSFDLVYCDYVLEHVENPCEFLGEVYRVLKPGSRFMFRTPNLFHYISMISSMTPHVFHTMTVNRIHGYDKDAHAPWPTFYRVNRRSTLQRLGKAAGFCDIELRMIECNPVYLEFHAIPFFAGVAYERLVNSHSVFSDLRANIFGRFTKPSPRPTAVY